VGERDSLTVEVNPREGQASSGATDPETYLPCGHHQNPLAVG